MKVLVLIVFVLALTLSACGSNDPVARHPSNYSRSVSIKQVELPDGRTVLCVMANNGVSCDWPGASR